MLKVGIIGIGNTGNQVAELARNTLNIPVIAINSSDKDLETLSSSVPKKLIKDNDGITAGEGAGKDRSLAKKYLKESIMELIKDEEIPRSSVEIRTPEYPQAEDTGPSD